MSLFGGGGKELWEELSGMVTRRLRDEGVKARLLKPERGRLELFSEDVARRGLLSEGFELLALVDSKNLYLAKTECTVDSEGFRLRDLGRPRQDPRVTMPPRLARLLVNLVYRRGGTLLDPFCGLGTILMEALVSGMSVVGVDIDRRMLSGAEENLSWLTRRLGRAGVVRLLKGDATRLSQVLRSIRVDAVATEPILLPPLRKPPKPAEAEEMVVRSGETYVRAIPEVFRVLKPGGRLSLVAPCVKAVGGELYTPMLREVFEQAGFRLVEELSGVRLRQPMLQPSTKDRRVVRAVYLAEKPV